MHGERGAAGHRGGGERGELHARHDPAQPLGGEVGVADVERLRVDARGFLKIGAERVERDGAAGS